MSKILGREVPLGLTMFIIALLFIDYYIEIDFIRNLSMMVQEWAIIIIAVMVGVGVLNLIIRTKDKIQGRKEYWYLDIWMLFMMVLMTILGLIGKFGTNPTFTWITQNAYLNLNASVYALVAFNITSALYRVFRIKNKEGAILFISALLSLIYNAPITAALFSWYMPIGKWVLNIPTSAGSRAFIIVTAIGLLYYTINVMLLREKALIEMEV